MPMFEREDWTFFRELSKLGQRAGVPVAMLPAVVLKELVDNALDAAGPEGYRADLLPTNGFYVQDGGLGIDGDDARIAELFSIRRPLQSSKVVRLPTRGALGNGLRVVAGAVLASGGFLTVTTRGRRLRLMPDHDTGTTLVQSSQPLNLAGTRVEVHLGSSLLVDEAVLEWPRVAFELARSGKRYKGKTNAHWYDSDSFFELLQAAKGQTAVDVVGSFDGCAHPKNGTIVRECGLTGRPATGLDFAESERLLAKIRESCIPVNSKRLGCVGQLVRGFPGYHAKAIGLLPRKPGRGSHEAQIPCVVEAWAKTDESPHAGFSVNRTPVADRFRAYHDPRSKEMKVFGSGISVAFRVGKKPAWLHVNVDTPFMPVTTDGKAPDLDAYLTLIGTVVESATKKARDAERWMKSLDGEATTQKDVILANLDAAIAKASEGGTYRFSLRQLFYAVRPHVIAKFGKEPDYGYFGQVITEYEEGNGRDISGMYRDSRGTLYHPHTGEHIQLGTLSVERYARPAWTFNKVLYCEKEGFFPIMTAARWPERHDCALMTSKGFASRAARDVIDNMGDTGEELTFYCIHDADAYGTTIYEKLQEATRARAARKVHIENLGLEPAEAIEMGLQVEDVTRKGDKSAAVASYVSAKWAEWLQLKRVELNAMTTGQFLAWLDSKFEGRDEKVIPPDDVLVDQLRDDVRSMLDDQIREQVLREARVEQRVDAELAARLPAIDDRSATLRDEIRDALDDDRAIRWTSPVAGIAEEITSAG